MTVGGVLRLLDGYRSNYARVLEMVQSMQKHTIINQFISRSTFVDYAVVE